MEIQYRRMSEITPYENNAKTHDQTQINNVAESIKQYGFVQPIVIDRDGVIVIGHCRTLAAKKLGMKSVPCVCVDDLTPDQVNALRLVDNKSNESPWNFDLLADELEGLDLTGFDFAWGLPEDFSDDELEAMMADEVEARKTETHRVTVDCNNQEETYMVAELLKENGYNPQVKNT